MVLRIDDRPALDVLTEAGRGLTDRPLVFTVLAEPEGVGAAHGGRPDLLVRGVQGVDSDRGGLMVSNEVAEGMRITFAVRDGRTAREDLEAITRELERDIAGAAPRFGLYLNCAGRGTDLYGAPDVDSRILRSRFPGVPIAGMQSSFELAPHLGRATLQLYTGVLGLFTSPS
jgi:small ligand-binding sensory domain FIST